MGPSIPALVASGADTRLGRRCRYGKRVDRKRMSGRGNHFCFAGDCAQWKIGTLAQTLISPLTKQASGTVVIGGKIASSSFQLLPGASASERRVSFSRPARLIFSE